MGNRKARSKDKRDADPPSSDRLADSRPSGSMTVELEAMTADKLAAASRLIASSRPVPPPPPTTARLLEDLAQTVEAPAIGPRLLIMDAAELVIADRGYVHTTAAEIAEWAGVSLDVFHAHFADERALLGALAERFWIQVGAATEDAAKTLAWREASPSTMIALAVHAAVDTMFSRVALVRAVLGSGDRDLIDAFRRVGTGLTVKLTRAIADLDLPTDARPDPHAIGFAVLLAVSLAHHAVIVGPEWSGVELDRETLTERAVHAATAYVESELASRKLGSRAKR